jgi:RNA polymerase sigma factor (sigma-70 family)
MEASALPLRPSPRSPRSPRLLHLLGDDRLVALVRGGNEAAFEAIYERHHRQLLSFCRHMLGQAEEGADALQHTFASAYRDLVGSEKVIRLRPWLFAIARNRCLSMLAARREQISLDKVEPATDGLAAEVQRREDLRDLLADLAGLPDRQREALVLSELGSLSHAEIAGVLGCRSEQVKALVFQARSSLATSRRARETPCPEIREQLATLRGASLRRATLQGHLRQCSGCAAFSAEVGRQRQAMALLLPVAPAPWLKQAALSSAGGAGAGSAGAAGGTGAAAGFAGLGAQGFAAKALALLALIGAGGAVAATNFPASGPPDRPASRDASTAVRARASAPAPAGSASHANPARTTLTQTSAGTALAVRRGPSHPSAVVTQGRHDQHGQLGPQSRQSATIAPSIRHSQSDAPRATENRSTGSSHAAPQRNAHMPHGAGPPARPIRPTPPAAPSTAVAPTNGSSGGAAGSRIPANPAQSPPPLGR